MTWERFIKNKKQVEEHMMDVLTKKQRSYCMSRIHARDTQPEILLRKVLSAAGIRGYRLNYNMLGRPDIVFPKRKIAIFIDGCFWHKCPKCFSKLSTTKKYWVMKIQSNMDRDRRVSLTLKKIGWEILRIWEHETKRDINRCLIKIKGVLNREIIGK